MNKESQHEEKWKKEEFQMKRFVWYREQWWRRVRNRRVEGRRVKDWSHLTDLCLFMKDTETSRNCSFCLFLWRSFLSNLCEMLAPLNNPESHFIRLSTRKSVYLCLCLPSSWSSSFSSPYWNKPQDSYCFLWPVLTLTLDVNRTSVPGT